MSEVTHISDYMPHVTFEAMCVHCVYRWIAVMPENTWLTNLECPECNLAEGVIATGQILEI